MKIKEKRISKIRISEMIGLVYRNKATGALLVFMVGMVIMSGITRIADSFMMPRAAVGALKEMSLTYPIEIGGCIEAKGTRTIYGIENLLVGEILVEVGDMVTEGDVLYSIDKKDLVDKMESIEREIKKLTLQIENLENNYERQLNERDKNISRAREDYEDAVNSSQSEVETAYQNMEDARSSLEDHENNPPSAAEVAQKDSEESSGDEAVETENESGSGQVEDAMLLWEQKRAELNQNYIQMKQLYDAAIRSGDETLKSAFRQLEDAESEITKDSSAISLAIDLEVLEKSMEELSACKKKEGKVYADADGKISSIHISVGSIMGGEPVIVMEDSQQEFRFEGKFDSSLSSLVKEGQLCEIELQNEGKKLESIKITKVSEDDTQGEASQGGSSSWEGVYKVTVDLDSEEIQKSGKGVLLFTKTSKLYQNCVPLSAVFQGSGGYYVLAVAESVTILGIQTTVVKIPVTIAEQNGEYAAVEGSFSGYGEVIVNASKAIKDGDRIRIVEDL